MIIRKQVLIAVESCQRNRLGPVHDAIRDTWFKNLGVTEKRFFYGAGLGMTLQCDDLDVSCLDCLDDYESLPSKTQAICQWSIKHDFDFLYKCDTDTVVNPWQFVFSGFENHDYFGGENADQNVPGFGPTRIEFCSGGAGYWLSRRAMQIVAETQVFPGQTAEDVFVASALLKHGIKPTFHPGYRWRPGVKIDKDVVSLHLSSALQKKYEPQDMYQAYEQIKGLQ